MDFGKFFLSGSVIFLFVFCAFSRRSEGDQKRSLANARKQLFLRLVVDAMEDWG